jgi:Thrombospondin type 1 domain
MCSPWIKAPAAMRLVRVFCGTRQVGAWSACSAECGLGSSNRSVACIASPGERLSEARCEARARPASSRSCRVRDCDCDFCASQNALLAPCSGRGSCTGGACRCAEGTRARDRGRDAMAVRRRAFARWVLFT